MVFGSLLSGVLGAFSLKRSFKIRELWLVGVLAVSLGGAYFWFQHRGDNVAKVETEATLRRAVEDQAGETMLLAAALVERDTLQKKLDSTRSELRTRSLQLERVIRNAKTFDECAARAIDPRLLDELRKAPANPGGDREDYRLEAPGDMDINHAQPSMRPAALDATGELERHTPVHSAVRRPAWRRQRKA